jgi:hypothetical protein
LKSFREVAKYLPLKPVYDKVNEFQLLQVAKLPGLGRNIPSFEIPTNPK